jgi:hypothetical protein
MQSTMTSQISAAPVCQLVLAGVVGFSFICYRSIPAAAQTTAPSTQPQEQPADPETQRIYDRLAEVACLNIARTHGDQAWRQHVALQANFEITANNSAPLAGTILLATNRDHVLMRFTDGPALLQTENAAYLLPSSAEAPADALFHLRVWPTLLAAPFKLHDPSWNSSAFKRRAMQNSVLGSFQLHPRETASNAPFSSAIAYFDGGTVELKALAFVPQVKWELIGNQTTRQFTVTFDEFKELEATRLPASISIWNWSEREGVQGERLAQVKFTNLAFVRPAEDAFSVPDGAQPLNVD